MIEQATRRCTGTCADHGQRNRGPPALAIVARRVPFATPELPSAHDLAGGQRLVALGFQLQDDRADLLVGQANANERAEGHALDEQGQAAADAPGSEPERPGARLVEHRIGHAAGDDARHRDGQGEQIRRGELDADKLGGQLMGASDSHIEVALFCLVNVFMKPHRF